jgi:hypothetical protein
MSKRPPYQINGYFVPLLIDTIDSPAWRAMSHGAQMLYVALKRRHNATINNNGKIFLSQRDAGRELNSHTDCITRWFRELQHYGFIVVAAAGCLGVEGRGKAPRWRLTEIECDGRSQTRDFTLWNGEPFENKKQNPVLQKRGTPSRKSGTLQSRKSGTPVNKSVPQKRDISEPRVSCKGGTDLDSSSHLSPRPGQIGLTAGAQEITMSNDEMKVLPDGSVLVSLSEEDIRRADKIAEARVARYLRGEKWEVKPWRLHELTDEECREWLASREEAGRKIEIAACEIGRWHVNFPDPYNVLKRLGEPLPEDCGDGCVVKDWFVRSPESRGWVVLSDLPESSAEALRDRIRRELCQTKAH